MEFDFDRDIERRGTNCAKWDRMEALYGVSADDGLPMWVADMDFATAPVVQEALRSMIDHGVLGYSGSDKAYREAVVWWYSNRHNWDISSDAIFTANGLVNAIALILDTYTDPGDEVILMSPVYHAFARVIRAAGRNVAERPMLLRNGRYEMDLEAWDAAMTGREKVIILCSPHNPGGRVWSRAEHKALAAFAEAHDLLLIADEIHQDLTYPGAQHIPFLSAAPGAAPRTVALSAPSKTFNTAGLHAGQVVIPHEGLREAFAKRLSELNLSPSSVGLEATRAAYSPEGAAWVDALQRYLDANRKLFDEGVNGIPGVKSMELDATYLAWVDFGGTGMSADEVLARVQGDARIAANLGTTFGSGGDTYLRFNFGTTRARVVEAVNRLQTAFADLQ